MAQAMAYKSPFGSPYNAVAVILSTSQSGLPEPTPTRRTWARRDRHCAHPCWSTSAGRWCSATERSLDGSPQAGGVPPAPRRLRLAAPPCRCRTPGSSRSSSLAEERSCKAASTITSLRFGKLRQPTARHDSGEERTQKPESYPSQPQAEVSLRRQVNQQRMHSRHSSHKRDRECQKNSLIWR